MKSPHSRRLSIVLYVLFVSALTTSALAEELTVAVASNFLGPARVLAAAFEKSTGNAVRISAGSTGTLYAQIVNGAPYDVFLAANAAEPTRLERAGAAVVGSRFTYAQGILVLWSADRTRIPGDGERLLKEGRFHRLALANPRTAPYGAAAMEVLESLNLAEELQEKLVRGENISQAFQYTASGNAELGFVALSQVRDPNHPHPGNHWLVPAALYHPIRQQAVLLTRAQTKTAARQFLDYLRSTEARNLIERYGYGIETGDAP